MSYKTILIHVNDERRCDRLLGHAIALAERFEAHLVGLYVAPLPIVYTDWTGGSNGDLIEQFQHEHTVSAEKLGEKFARATRNLRRPAEWRFVRSMMTSAAEDVMLVGRCADLIIASQSDPEWYQTASLDVPDRLAIESGRPVLVIPNAEKLSATARRITVGWNERREAARAVFDALPLLKLAEAVNVVRISPASGALPAGDLPGSDLCRTLSRHGVKCAASWAESSDLSAGAELLRQAKANGSELIVMGAYGHTRIREFVLGGASRHIFSKSHIPVLMSH